MPIKSGKAKVIAITGSAKVATRSRRAKVTIKTTHLKRKLEVRGQNERARSERAEREFEGKLPLLSSFYFSNFVAWCCCNEAGDDSKLPSTSFLCLRRRR